MASRVVLVAVGALVIVLGFGLLALVRTDPAPDPGPQPSPSPTPVEQTLLLQVLDADSYALGNVVIGIEPAGQAETTTFLQVPASLLVPVGDDSVTLGLTPAAPDTLAGVKGVSQELSLRLDAGLTLDRLAFAGLVDAVDGIWVKLPAAVVLPRQDGSEVRVLGPGWVKMDGVTAADYVVARIPGEDDAARIARVSAVLDLVLQRLPYEPERMRQLLTSLGSLAQSTVPTEQLVPFLLQVSADVQAKRTQHAVLPVEIIRVGVRPASIPAPDAEALVQELFPDARLEPAL